MKHIKRMFALVLALALALCFAAPAFAVDITITDQDANSTYTAYPLFDAKYERSDATGDIYIYTVNETFKPAVLAGLKAAAPESAYTDITDDNIQDILDLIRGFDADKMRTFADAAFTAIQGNEAMKAAGTASSGNEFKGVPGGYYLISETVKAGDNDTVTSLVMLDTAGKENLTVATKEEKPSSEKKVQDVNDTNGEGTDWQDSADYDIGDKVPFQLTGTLPANYTTYDSYKIVFHDIASTGLTFDGEGTIEISCDGGESFKLPHVGIELKENVNHGSVEAPDIHSFDLEIDVKTAFPAATDSSKIVVKYTATLNENAVIGSAGNPNEMYMEYTNDHYSDGTGTTPKDKVTVFTFELDVTKKDGAKDPNEAGVYTETLKGAGFTLFKKYKSYTPETDNTELKLNDDGSVTAVGKDGDYFKKGEGESAETWVQVGEELKGGDMTTFKFEGLDDGEYLLVETTVPDGYNKAKDIDFTITATHAVNSDDPTLDTLVVSPDGTGIVVEMTEEKPTGKLTTDVVNMTGVELPSTGGIGTTLFYVVGGILVAGAAILLFTKKRVDNGNK